jgi:hypothetical protein
MDALLLVISVYFMYISQSFERFHIISLNICNKSYYVDIMR